MDHVGIPRFDSQNELHQKLALLSKTLHKFKANDKKEEITKLEKEVDRSVNELFGIDNS